MQTINQHLIELQFLILDFVNFAIQKNPDYSFVSRLEKFYFNYFGQDWSTTFNLLVNHNGPTLRLIEVYRNIVLIQRELDGKHLHNSLYSFGRYSIPFLFLHQS